MLRHVVEEVPGELGRPGTCLPWAPSARVGSSARLGDVVDARRAEAAPAAVREDLPGLAQLSGMRGNLRSFVAAASSAFTTAAYWSTYSCSESERIAYMISSVIARRTAFSLSMPS